MRGCEDVCEHPPETSPLSVGAVVGVQPTVREGVPHIVPVYRKQQSSTRYMYTHTRVLRQVHNGIKSATVKHPLSPSPFLPLLTL